MVNVKLMGERLSERRRDSGMTLRQVEDQAGVSYANLCRMEKGRTVPTLHTLKRLCELYSASPAYFMGME